jgi:aminopeptidase N
MRPNLCRRGWIASLVALAFATPAAIAAPILFPPLPDGRQEVREEADVAPYLAAWKAARFAHERAAALPATANQQQYDARWYDLNLTFTFATTSVAGTARMKASVTSGPISTVDLDFYANMIVDAATSAGAATTFSRAGNVLTLNLDRAYNTGETFDVTVTYHGNPTAAGYFFFQTVNSRQLISSLSEAYGARTWWPCKDAPEDKADSVDVHFTAPVALTTVSNGKLIGRVVNGSVATTNWHERYPIATYLVSVASYPYTVTDDWYRPTPTDSMLIRFHNYPESAAGAAAVQAKVKDMIAAFATRFGEYPFIAEKYGHAQFQFGGGMEHQTCTSLGAFNEFVVAHELAHQWWGDLVTCRDFHHIWLNEGFATYGEALWMEATSGIAAYHGDIDLNRYLGPGTIWVPDATDENRVFDSGLSYDKGSWVLHMLRHVLGDATFFDAMRAYHTTWGYQSAVTEDFRDVCEAVSGRDLDAFFQQWIYGEYYPIYRPTWSAAAAGGGFDVTLTLGQTQSWQLFKMPVDVTVTTSSGETTFVVQDSLASQTFVLHVNGSPTAVQIDKDNWILKQTETFVVNPTFERRILLVNGVDWNTYGSEITSAYTDHAFSGAYPFDFWDNFAAPGGGYPAALPAPLGHGQVPAEVLGHYRNVVWVGNHFNGDLAAWQDTPILSYLHVGGNVLLMARFGDAFLGDSLRDYLGITWTYTGNQLYDCLPMRPGLSSMALLGAQSLCAAFDTTVATTESQPLFRISQNYPGSQGIGVVRIPANGGSHRAQGARFAFLSGRPYRWNHTALQNNVSAILASYFLEPLPMAGVGAPAAVAGLALASPRPNPFHDATALHFTLPRAQRVRLVLIDVTGRRMRTLANGALAAGAHDLSWDGRDDHGSRVPAGLYWARLETEGEAVVRRLVRMR